MKKNQLSVEVLVQWANRAEEDATWEDYQTLSKQFPDFCLEDKINSEGKVLSAAEIENGWEPLYWSLN
jgi:Chromo (CHRromatin Organisation MOdifier) domain